MAAWPEEKEQLWRHWSEKANARENSLLPPNSIISLGLARPKLSFNTEFTVMPGAIIAEIIKKNALIYKL